MWGAFEQGGIDQGFHNVLFHRYPSLMRPHPVTIVPSEGGWLSSQYDCHPNMKVGEIWEPYHLSRPAIIHQYDRCAALKNAVDAYFKR